MAVQHLVTLIQREKAYRQYAAWPPLAYALFQCGLSDECLAALRKLVDENPRMDHKVLLAHYLAQASEADQARTLLQEALSEHDRSPRFLRRRNLRKALQARNMLRAMGKSS